jgi:hypothetical protein
MSNFEIIFLNETWTNKSSKLELNGYKLYMYHSFRKYQNKRAKRSNGGILPYVKNSIVKGEKLVKKTM